MSNFKFKFKTFWWSSLVCSSFISDGLLPVTVYILVASWLTHLFLIFLCQGSQLDCLFPVVLHQGLWFVCLFSIVLAVFVPKWGQKSWLPETFVAPQQGESLVMDWNMLNLGVVHLVGQEHQRGWHSLMGYHSGAGLECSPNNSRCGYRDFPLIV